MLRINKRKISKVIVVVMMYVMSLSVVKASSASLDFVVNPIYPSSQIEGNTSYYNLLLEPGVKETIQLEVVNTSSEDIEVEISTHTAFTNVNGVVEYASDAEEYDKSLEYRLGEIISSPGIINVSGNETKVIDLAFEMPSESFEGIIAGGIRLSQVNSPDESEASEGFSINNEIIYVISVLLRNNEERVAGDLELLDVYANQVNYRNVISAKLQNFEPGFINQLEVEAQVRALGEEEVLYESSSSGMQMAPNSFLEYPISLNGERHRPGKYVLNLVARSHDEEWVFEQEFEIESDIANDLNAADVTIDNSINWWAVGFIGVILVFVIYIVIEKKRNKKH